MSQQSCGVCGSTVSNGQWLCVRCQNQTRHHLADLPEHALELHTMLQRMVRMGAVNDGGKAADPALTWQRVGDQFLADVTAYLKANPVMVPYAKPAGDLLRELRRMLLRWCLVAAKADRSPVPIKSTIPVLSGYLLDHANALYRTEGVGKLTVALDDWVRRCAAAIDLPSDRTRFVAGPCPELRADGEHCTGQVWARFPQGEGWGQEAPAPTMKCTVCGTVWESPQFNRTGNRIEARRQELKRAETTAKQETA